MTDCYHRLIFLRVNKLKNRNQWVMKHVSRCQSQNENRESLFKIGTVGISVSASSISQGERFKMHVTAQETNNNKNKKAPKKKTVKREF